MQARNQTTTAETAVLSAALAYAEHGWFVFPCIPAGEDKKSPFTLHGYKDAATDPKTIREWWARWPDALIGVACGASGLVVIDPDMKHGVDGITNFDALGIAYDHALVSRTPTGGLHVLFTDTTGGAIHNSAGKLAPGVDVRGDRGYFIAPPSVTPEGAYVQLTDWTVTPPPVPDALVALLLPPKRKTTTPTTHRATTTPRGNGRAYGDAALAAELARVGQAAEGTRNDTLNAAAFNLGQLVGGGELEENEVRRALLGVALGWEAKEHEPARNTIKSGLTAGKAQPRTRPQSYLESANSATIRPPMPEAPPDQDTYHDAPAEAVNPWLRSIRTLADAYRIREPLTYLVDGLIEAGSLSVLFGAPGALKSMLAADLCVCVAGGTPWLPEAMDNAGALALTTTLGKVLWVDFDNGARRTDERIEALARSRGLTADNDHLFFLSMPVPWLDATKDVSALLECVDTVGADLVVIDNLGVVSGCDENSADMAQAMSNFRTITEATGAALVLIHHQRKTGATKGARLGETLRGHSSIEASLDMALLVQRDDVETELVKLVCTKSRGVPIHVRGARFSYEHRWGTKELSRAHFTGELILSRADRAFAAIIQAVEGAPGLTKGALVQAAAGLSGLGRDYITRQIDVLLEGEHISETPGARGSKCYTTELV